MHISEFDFDLPPELIAQQPPAQRGASRLLVLDRATGAVRDRAFADLPSLFRTGDLLVANDTKVFPARLLGRRLPGGGSVECLLVRPLEKTPHGEVWEALVHPGQRLRPGSRMEFASTDQPAIIHGEILEQHFHGRRTVRLWSSRGGSRRHPNAHKPRVGDPATAPTSLDQLIDSIGHVPLPPYIKRSDVNTDRDRYQTVYARERGSIAAPTAGLHFTPQLLGALDAGGVERTTITLHVGYGTFQPVRIEDVAHHAMEAEDYEVTDVTASALTRTLSERRRIIAVGTTTTRALESLAIDEQGVVAGGRGRTNLFIYPGYQFRLVSGLVTNFHLPRSSLLMLVCAFGGREAVLAAYRHAVNQGYRFYSYGDAMVIV